MSIAAIHDRIMDAAKIESALILLPTGSWRKQNFRTRLSAGCGYRLGREGCPPGRGGRPSRRRLSGPGSLLEPVVLSGSIGSLSGPGSPSRPGSPLRAGSLPGRRGCPSGGLI